MTFEAAQERYPFLEEVEHRDPLGYGRYLYREPQGKTRISLHVDVKSDPRRVIGVTYEFPADSADALRERFGEPVHTDVKAEYRIVSFRDETCGMSAKVSTRRENPQLVLGVAISSDAARAEYKRRKDAAAGDAKAPAGG
jgi:hypothetical protein